MEQFLSHTRFWEGLERHLHFCLSTNEELLKNCISLRDTCLQTQILINSKEKMDSYGILITVYINLKVIRNTKGFF